MFRKASRCKTRSGFLQESLGPVMTFSINHHPIWQGKTWDRRVGKAAEYSMTVTQCLPVSRDPARD